MTARAWPLFYSSGMARIVAPIRPEIHGVFVTRVYRAALVEASVEAFNNALAGRTVIRATSPTPRW